MSSLLLDLRYARRMLLSHAGASLIGLVTLSLAIGAATAIFSVVYGVLLRPLPYPRADRIVAVWEVNHAGGFSRLADPNFDDFRDRSHAFSALAKYTEFVTSVTGGAEPARAHVAVVTKDFFSVLGVGLARGRGITAADARVGADPVALVSHRYWTESLGSTDDLAARRLRLDDRAFAVIGVLPAGFQFPAGVDVWVPAELNPENTSRTSHNFRAIGRLRDGVTAARAAADVSAIARDIIRQSPEQGEYLLTDATAVPLIDSLTGRVSSTLYTLLGAVLFLLLIACANVAHLLLAQASARQRELAIRHALGAARGRLVRQFITEAVMLLGISALAGILIAMLGVRALVALAPPSLPRLEDVSISAAVLAFAIGVSAVVAIGLGLITAWRASRRDPRRQLADTARGQAGGAASRRAGRLIVGAQMALTVVLLIGAALLGRSLQRVLAVDPGFRTEGIVAMDLSMPYVEGDAAKARLASFYESLFDRLRAVGGVQYVAAATAIPLDTGLPDGTFAIAGPNDVPKDMAGVGALFAEKDRLGTADFCAVSPEYFRALEIPLKRGRLFDEHDGSNAAHVAVISESLARARWPDQDPLGRTIEFGNMDGDLRLLTIVGIVGDTREAGLEQPPRPTVFVNLLQRPSFTATVVLRSTASAGETMAAARAILKSAAPDVPPKFRTFDDVYVAALGPRHFNLTLVSVFAVTALVLALAGMYGVMAYSVSERRREIGVRLALGATPRAVLRLLVGQGLAATSAGVLAGVGGALLLTRTIESWLFGVTPTDPLTFAGVVTLLLAVSALACVVPARRAIRADPIAALRQD